MGGPRHPDISVGRSVLEADFSALAHPHQQGGLGFMGGGESSRVEIYSSTLLAHILATP